MVTERMAVGDDMGFTGYFTDPEGNLIGLWDMASPLTVAQPMNYAAGARRCTTIASRVTTAKPIERLGRSEPRESRGNLCGTSFGTGSYGVDTQVAVVVFEHLCLGASETDGTVASSVLPPIELTRRAMHIDQRHVIAVQNSEQVRQAPRFAEWIVHDDVVPDARHGDNRPVIAESRPVEKGDEIVVIVSLPGVG